MRSHLNVQNATYAGVLIITLAGLISMALINRGLYKIRQSLRHIIEIEQPISADLYEMEINSNESIYGVLAYIDTGLLIYRETFIKDSQEFRKANEGYKHITISQQYHALAQTSAAIFGESYNLSQYMMALKDQQDALINTIAVNLGRSDTMIRQVLTIDSSTGKNAQAVKALRKTLKEFTAAKDSLSGYFYNRQAEQMRYIALLSSQGRNDLTTLAKGNIPKVKRMASEIDVLLDITAKSVYEYLAHNHKLHQDTAKLLDLRQQLDNLLDKHIQALSTDSLPVSVDKAYQAMDSIKIISKIALPLSMILSVFSAMMMLRMARRPLKALKERAATLVTDGIRQRLKVRAGDDFFNLAQYFNMILDQLETTMVSKDMLEAVNHELRMEIVERKAMQKALGKLSHKLIETQESERRHIARELHDHIGQSLTALKINIESRQANPAQAAANDLDNHGLIVEMLTQVRNLSLDLRPPLLDDLGLVPALRWYLDQQAQRNGFTIEFAASTIVPRPSYDVENCCFRITQEALTNIVRHAKVTHVRVSLELKEEFLLLTVHDNGIGFDVAEARKDAMKGVSLGLLGMEERAQLIGGHIQFASAPEKGTEIRAMLPLAVPEEIPE